MKKIKNPQPGNRLDIFLHNQIEYSRNAIKIMIKHGKVRINSKIITKAAYIIREKDIIEVDIPEIKKLEKLLPENIPINIVYEDQDILVINKPAGLVVHPSAGNFSNTLVNALLYHTKNLSSIGPNNRPGIVHRLDKYSEGLLVVAKNNQAHKQLAKQFKVKVVEKKYYAVVKGDIKDDERIISFPLCRNPKDRVKMKVSSTNNNKAKQAWTKIKVLKRFITKTLLEVSTTTGRMHQIRVHLAYIGHPLLGDPDYLIKPAKRHYGQLLQAFYLAFNHPKTGKRISFEIPISERLGI